MNNMDSIPIPAAGFSVRQLGEETIILAQNGDNIHSLDEVGTFFWQAIDGKRSLREMVSIICAEYEANQETIQTDLLEFVASLAEKNIIRIEE